MLSGMIQGFVQHTKLSYQFTTAYWNFPIILVQSMM